MQKKVARPIRLVEQIAAMARFAELKTSLPGVAF